MTDSADVDPNLFTIGIGVALGIGALLYEHFSNENTRPHQHREHPPPRTYPENLSKNPNTRSQPGCRKKYGNENCTICLEKIKPKNKKSLQCGHDFHLECILQWIQITNCCPNCKAVVPV